MPLSGIDVSEYQGSVDWPKVADQGIAFAFIKSSEGQESFDPLFAKNWAAAKAVGIVCGAYHFYVTNRDPKLQAKNFLSRVQASLEAHDLAPVLDFESLKPGISAATAIAGALEWLSIVETATGRKPLVYTFPSFWDDQLGNPQAFADYPLWIAHFGTQTPIVPKPWRTWAFHQYTETGQIAGVAGNVDRNNFSGTLDDLQKYLKAKPPLRQGSSGKLVAELQTLLNANGLAIGVADGKFGPNTKNAVLTFQKSKQLKPDGIVGPKTWALLQSPDGLKSDAKPDASKPNNPSPPVELSLLEAVKTYKAQPHQDAALQWLQTQLPPAILSDFRKRWQQP